MMTLDIPGSAALRAEYLVCDYNGTLARDGALLAVVPSRLRALAAFLEIHVVTADTFGVAARELSGLPVRLNILPPGNQTRQKADYVRRLGAERTVAIGNGRNDRAMLKAAALGICLVESEGCCADSLRAADVVCRSVEEALDLLLHPRRLKATLRS